MRQTDPCGGILAAGLGTRLRPLTEHRPKPLIPFLNRPLVSYGMEQLAAAGVERVGLNLHYRGELVPPVADEWAEQFGLKASYEYEPERRGTAGGIRSLWDALGEPDATLIVNNGDSPMSIELARHLRRHRRSGRDVTLVVRPSTERRGSLWSDQERVIGLREFRVPDAGSFSSPEEHDFVGVHLIEPTVLESIPLEPGCIIDDVYGPLLEDGATIGISQQRGYWRGIDTPEMLMAATRDLLDEPSRLASAPDPSDSTNRRSTDDPESGRRDIEVVSPVVIGPEVEFDGPCRVGPYAVIDRTRLAAGTAVEHSIVYDVGERRRDAEWTVAIGDGEVSLEPESVRRLG